MDVTQIFVCEECGSAYTGREIYGRHLEIAHNKKIGARKIIENAKSKSENVKSAPTFVESYLPSKSNKDGKDTNTKNQRADFPRVSIDPFEPKEKNIIEEVGRGVAAERLAQYLNATGSSLAKEIPKRSPTSDGKANNKNSETIPTSLEEISKKLLPIHLDMVKLSQIPPILGLQLEVSMGQLTNWCNQVEKYIEVKGQKKGLFRAKKRALLSNFEKILVQSREYINNTLRPEVKKCSAICSLLEQQFNEVESIRTNVNVMINSGSYSKNEISELATKYDEISKTFLREIVHNNKKALFWNATVDEIYNQVKEMTNLFNEQIDMLSKEFDSKMIFTLFLPQKVIFI
ncbi:coiled coil-containing protein [Cryptosporidium canis]|uniref:Coiled coil-containing protein n=1 Tax=Cryptosporidium canis TaxID=195482 RepID=A0A9D5DJN3_9CRYT|nr:coiled coil-containing protein [Cryptosporidium canis]